MKMYRASGKPVRNQDNEKYLSDLNLFMDALEIELGKCNPDNAKEFEKRLEEYHDTLLKLYPTCIEIEDKPNLIKLVKEYESVAFCLEDDKLVAYVLDA